MLVRLETPEEKDRGLYIDPTAVVGVFDVTPTIDRQSRCEIIMMGARSVPLFGKAKDISADINKLALLSLADAMKEHF